jgi:hypothetical protein
VALSRREVHEPRRADLALLITRSNQQPTLDDDDQRMLMNLMIIKPVALRQRQQDHPTRVLIRTQHPRGTSLNPLKIQHHASINAIGVNVVSPPRVSRTLLQEIKRSTLSWREPRRVPQPRRSREQQHRHDDRSGDQAEVDLARSLAAPARSSGF